jgi:hypothetical protein
MRFRILRFICAISQIKLLSASPAKAVEERGFL